MLSVQIIREKENVSNRETKQSIFPVTENTANVKHRVLIRCDWPGKGFKVELLRKVNYFIYNILETHEQHGGKRKTKMINYTRDFRTRKSLPQRTVDRTNLILNVLNGKKK